MSVNNMGKIGLIFVIIIVVIVITVVVLTKLYGCSSNQQKYVNDGTLINVVLFPDRYEGIYTIHLSSERVLTASVGAMAADTRLEYHDYISTDFVLGSVEETQSIELTEEQFETLQNLMSRIKGNTPRQRGQYICEGCWYLDVIYKGKLYSYFFDDVYEDVSGSYMTKLVKKIFEYSPISLPERHSGS